MLSNTSGGEVLLPLASDHPLEHESSDPTEDAGGLLGQFSISTSGAEETLLPELPVPDLTEEGGSDPSEELGGGG